MKLNKKYSCQDNLLFLELKFQFANSDVHSHKQWEDGGTKIFITILKWQNI